MSDLKIDLNNSSMFINNDIIESNEIYKTQGYIPYFARRRVSLHEGEKFEIVNDISVELEFANLHSYHSRECADRQHIHDLLEYMSSQDTLFVPWGLYETPVTSGEKYRHANMAYQIVKFYISNIIKKIKPKLYILNGNCNHTPEDVKSKIESFIFKKDLIDFITTSFKLGNDITVSEIFSSLLYFLSNEKYYEKYFHEKIVERMVVCIYVGSSRGDISSELVYFLHNYFPELIAHIASIFNPIEAGLIELRYIDSKYIYKYGYQILKNQYDPFDVYYYNTPNYHCNDTRSETPENYYLKSIKSVPKNEEFNFQLMLMNTKNFDKNVNLDENVFNPGIYLYADFSRINDIMKKNQLKDLTISEAVSESITNIISELKYPKIDSVISHYISNINIYIENANRRKVSSKIEDIRTIPEYQPIIQLMSQVYDDDKFRNMINSLIKTGPFNLVRLLVELIPRYNSSIGDRKKYFVLDNDKLDFLSSQIEITTLMHAVDIYENFDWIESNYGKLFIELPDYIFSKDSVEIPEYVLNRIFEMLTDEQKEAYPFPINLMRKYQNYFKPLVSILNVDRYISAYGINWVECNTEISISDIVNAKAYVSKDVIERYIDIILLDKDLRSKFLSNKEICQVLVDGKPSILDMVLNSDTFNNEIKCEVMFNVIKWNNVHLLDYTKYLYGSGYYGRALIGLLAIKDSDKEKYLNILKMNIFDIEPVKEESKDVSDKLRRLDNELQ